MVANLKLSVISPVYYSQAHHIYLILDKLKRQCYVNSTTFPFSFKLKLFKTA